MSTISSYFHQEDNPDFDLAKLDTLSEKSSKPLQAKCPTCGHKWTTCKRSLTNGYHCPVCKKRNQSFWVTPNGKQLEKQVTRHTGHETPASEQTVDIQCPSCNKVLRKTVKQLNKETTENIWKYCGLCYPAPRVKTGELFLANYPEVKEHILTKLTDDVVLQTSIRLSFLKECGHPDEQTPVEYLATSECSNCSTTKKKARQTFYDTHRTEQGYKFTCRECNQTKTLSHRQTKRLAMQERKDYICKPCTTLTSSSSQRISTVIGSWNIEWAPENAKTPEQVTTGSGYMAQLQCSENHRWETPVYAITGSCPKCNGSSIEHTVESILKELDIVYVKHDRSTISPLEIDFYIPSLNLAIEVNGVYWHSEQHKPKGTHYEKFRKLQEYGIDLLVIWEDDMRLRLGIVKRILAHKTLSSRQDKIAARRTKITLVEASQAKEFMNNNHIQGFKTATYHIGLEYGSKLVSLLSVTVQGEVAYINRYATSSIVQGGFTRLLASFRRMEPSVNTVITYSDNSVSTGALYSSSGFSCEAELEPDYSYLYKGKRVHKFNFRKKRFKTDPELEYVPGCSESELARMNQLNRIWDYGKKRWVLQLHPVS